MHRLSVPSLLCQDNTRISSAGCLGELCAFLTEEELSTVLQQCLLGRSLLHAVDFSWGLSALGELWVWCFPFPSEGLLAAALASPGVPAAKTKWSFQCSCSPECLLKGHSCKSEGVCETLSLTCHFGQGGPCAVCAGFSARMSWHSSLRGGAGPRVWGGHAVKCRATPMCPSTSGRVRH